MPTSLVKGHTALDTILQSLAPKLVETWPGDEALVGMIVRERDKIAMIWSAREWVVGDLTRRGASEQDPQRRQRYASAIAVLAGPRAAGKVSLLVAGWGDMQTVEIEAEDLRAGRSITSWKGGNA